MQQKIFFLGVLVIIAVFFLQLYQKRDRFLTPYSYRYFSDKYLVSQYVMGEGSTYILPDYELYSYAGYYYITGGDVSRVNFENPPLAKYLIGISIFLFGNPLIIYLILAVFYLFLTYKFAKLLFSSFIGLVALLGLVIDPYFIHAVTYTHLDFPLAVFFLAGLYIFLTAKSLRQDIIAAVFFGLAVSSKFFPFFAVIFVYLFCWRMKEKKREKGQLWRFLLILPSIIIVYFAAYTQYFLSHTLIDFLKYQWWVLRWRMGNPIVVGNILQSIFFGRLATWWEKVPTFHYWLEEWSPLLPVVVVGAFMSIVFFYHSRLYRFIYGYVMLFFLYIFFFTEGGLKYLAPMYPFFAIFTAAMIMRISKLLKSIHHDRC
ncbi:glycosyltransferase family 39 protein [Candidatus Woesebacteria bacterium]|nr:glycosyltransferase family 39 protein [Candidatus Woesebacteria bacterium]